MVEKTLRQWSQEIIDLAVAGKIDLSHIQKYAFSHGVASNKGSFISHRRSLLPREAPNLDEKIKILFNEGNLAWDFFNIIYLSPLKNGSIYRGKTNQINGIRSVVFGVNIELYRMGYTDKLICLHDFLQMNGYTRDTKPTFFGEPNLTGVTEIDEKQILEMNLPRKAEQMVFGSLKIELSFGNLEKLLKFAIKYGAQIETEDGKIKEVRSDKSSGATP